MFTRNDPNPEKRFFNGKIGRITKIKKDFIFVQCADEEDTILVETLTWENLKFSLNESSKEIEEETVGKFTQYPLKLAWAITIHKSQGLTFEKVIIDAQAAFAHGQVYVALSRCKTFEGILLRTPLALSSVRTDATVKSYTQHSRANEPDADNLKRAKKEYQEKMLLDFFSLASLKKNFAQLSKVAQDHERSFQGSTVGDIQKLLLLAEEKLFGISDKFTKQLEAYYTHPFIPEEHEVLVERLKKAGAYFSEQLKGELREETENFQILSDNKSVKSLAKEKLEELKQNIFITNALAEVCQKGFSSKEFSQAAANAELDYQAYKKQQKFADKPKRSPKDAKHPVLYQRLAAWRAEMADQMGVERYNIMPTKTLLEVVDVLPTQLDSLKKIHGLGKKRIENFGKDLVKLVKQFAQENQLEGEQLQLATKKRVKALKPKGTKVDSKAVSFELFRQGKTVEEIAKERNLVKSTIFNHLIHFVDKGELDVFEILDKSKVEDIQAYFIDAETDSLAASKDHFGSRYEYWELMLGRTYWRKTK